jgi:outer membrane protein OmpA-like peptidoglycan-associated protein
MRDYRPAASACLVVALLAGCAHPVDRQPQMINIQSNVEQTFGGDVGALIFHGYQAAKQAEAAEAARAELASQPPYIAVDIRLSGQASELADQAAEHRRRAEAALDRIIDPLRGRIAKLEASQQAASPAVRAEVHFTGRSDALPARETVKLQGVAHYLARHPRSNVTITGFADAGRDARADREISRRRANAVYDALRTRGGLPLDAIVSVIGAGSNPAATDPVTEADPAGRRVLIEVRPLG